MLIIINTANTIVSTFFAGLRIKILLRFIFRFDCSYFFLAAYL